LGAAVDQLFTPLAGQAIAAGLAGEVEQEEASALPGTDMEFEPDESIIAALVDRIRPLLDV